MESTPNKDIKYFSDTNPFFDQKSTRAQRVGANLLPFALCLLNHKENNSVLTLKLTLAPHVVRQRRAKPRINNIGRGPHAVRKTIAITIPTLFQRHKAHVHIVLLIQNRHNNRCTKMVKYVKCIFSCIVSAMGFLLQMSARALVGLLAEEAAYGEIS